MDVLHLSFRVMRDPVRLAGISQRIGSLSRTHQKSPCQPAIVLSGTSGVCYTNP
jgi:hypothetical protein